MPKILPKNNKGIALVMSLMILSVAMLTGLFMNSIIVGEVRVSLNTVNVVNSYYAAESGIERALYFLTADANEVADNLDYYESLDDVPGNQIAISNKAHYTYATTSLRAATFVANNLNNTNSAHVSIIDPRGNIPLGLDWASQSGAVTAHVQWKIHNCFPDHASDRLEVTRYSIARSVADPFINQDVDKIVGVCNCSRLGAIDSCQGIDFSDLSSNKYYRFIFRPLDADVDRLEFSLGINGIDEDIWSEALIQAEGGYGSSQYRLQARMSALSPTSDIFSFVIFSEEELNKQ